MVAKPSIIVLGVVSTEKSFTMEDPILQPCSSETDRRRKDSL